MFWRVPELSLYLLGGPRCSGGLLCRVSWRQGEADGNALVWVERIIMSLLCCLKFPELLWKADKDCIVFTCFCMFLESMFVEALLSSWQKSVLPTVHPENAPPLKKADSQCCIPGSGPGIQGKARPCPWHSCGLLRLIDHWSERVMLYLLWNILNVLISKCITHVLCISSLVQNLSTTFVGPIVEL